MTLAENLVFRDAREEDLPLIIAMYFDDEHGSDREIVSDPLPPKYLEAFTRIEARHDSQLIVVELAGKIVCTFQIDILTGLSRGGSKRLQIEAVRVAAGQRGQGIGHIAMKWAIDEARAQDCGLVQLTTDKTRGSARAFYEQLGFSASHEGMKLLLKDPKTL